MRKWVNTFSQHDIYFHIGEFKKQEQRFYFLSETNDSLPFPGLPILNFLVSGETTTVSLINTKNKKRQNKNTHSQTFSYTFTYIL